MPATQHRSSFDSISYGSHLSVVSLRKGWRRWQRSAAAANRKSLHREPRQGLALPREPPRSSKRRREKRDASATAHCHVVVLSGKLASSWKRWGKVRWRG